MKIKLFCIALFLIGIFAVSGSARAQYMPSAPGVLGVGAVTENSIEWTFNLGGAMVTEVQLFVGDEATPRATQAVANYATSIVETGLDPNTRYTGRKIRAVYYGTAGAMSAEFPAGVTLQKVPTLQFEAIPSQNNAFLHVGSVSQIGTELSAWQLYDVERDTAWKWIKTQSFQTGPFEPGKSYAFKVRARNFIGKPTEWSQPITYAPLAGNIAPSHAPVSKLEAGKGVSALNVRSIPSLAGKRLGWVRPGKAFEILGSQNGWYRIQLTPALSGWVSGKYVTVVP